MDSIRLDSYKSAREAILAKSSSVKLVVLCFIETWNKISMHTAQLFEKFRANKEMSYAHIFIIDNNQSNEAAFDYGVAVTPAVVFIWEGKPLNVQRPNWNDDCKFVGATSEENYASLIRFAKETGESGKYDLIADII